MTAMPWVFDDGGRKAAGYTGRTSDCVVRSICVVAGLDYSQVYDDLYAGSRAYATRSAKAARRIGNPSPRDGVAKVVYGPYLDGLGFVWTPLMKIGSGCQVHLLPGEVPDTGRHILRLSKHLAALVDGVVHDTHDPSRDGTRCVYGLWTYAGSA